MAFPRKSGREAPRKLWFVRLRPIQSKPFQYEALSKRLAREGLRYSRQKGQSKRSLAWTDLSIEPKLEVNSNTAARRNSPEHKRFPADYQRQPCKNNRPCQIVLSSLLVDRACSSHFFRRHDKHYANCCICNVSNAPAMYTSALASFQGRKKSGPSNGGSIYHRT